MKKLIRNARVVDAGMDEQVDVLIKDGRIAALGFDFAADGADEVVDASGLVLMPAFVDMHAHFRDPGYTQKEDIASGSLAAAHGGYSTVNLMANTDPVASDMRTISYVRSKAAQVGLVRVHQCASLTRDFDGKSLDHIDALDENVRFLSEDGRGVMSNYTMWQAMCKAKERGMTIISHAEDMDLSPTDYRLAENIATVRDLELCEATGARLHMAHVSTKEAIESIIEAKKRGVNVTCEVTPHHLALWDEAYKVNPPIRARRDSEALLVAIEREYVDCIATDHAPHTLRDKRAGACGLVGLETAFAVCYTHLVRRKCICLSQLSYLMSAGPAKLMGLPVGRILPGMDADLVLVDVRKSFSVDPEAFASKGRNTPFAGRTLWGAVRCTMKQGQVTYNAGV
nr:dihydroorotase [Maliibacterium massiliense]